MSTNIKLKRSSVAGNVPTTSQLSLGELAINTVDGAIYSKKSDNTIFAIHDDDILRLDDSTNNVNKVKILETVKRDSNNERYASGSESGFEFKEAIGLHSDQDEGFIKLYKTDESVSPKTRITGIQLKSTGTSYFRDRLLLGAEGTALARLHIAAPVDNNFVRMRGYNSSTTEGEEYATLLDITQRKNSTTPANSSSEITMYTSTDGTQSTSIYLSGDADTTSELNTDLNIAGTTTFTNGAIAFNGENFSVNPDTAARTITLGKTDGTGTITIGRSTKDNTINIGNAATESDQEQIINIGSGTGNGLATVNIAAKSSQGNDTAVTIGGNDPSSGTTTVAIRGTTTFSTGPVDFNGHDFTVAPVLSTYAITLGSATQQGTITLGQSTATNTINIGNGNVASTDNQTVNIASGQGSGMHTVKIAAPSAQGHDTNVTIGGSDQTFGTQTVAIRGNTTFTHGDFGVVPLGGSADDTITLGSTNQTGSITLGQSTKTQTINIGTGGVESGETKSINIGTANSTGSATEITIGPNSSTAARDIEINGDVVFANNSSIKRNVAGTDVSIPDSVQLVESMGWVTYAGTNARQYMDWDESNQAVKLLRPSTMQSGLLYKAVKVYAGHKVHISFMTKSGGSGPSSGKYIQIYQYDGSALPSGKTHVGDTGLGSASTFVQNDNTTPITLVNNGGTSTSWITTTYEYVPANDGFMSIGIYFTIAFGQIPQYVKTPKITNAGLSRMEALAVQYIFG